MKDYSDSSMSSGKDESVQVPLSLLGGQQITPGMSVMMKVKNVKGNMAELMYSPPMSDKKDPVSPDVAQKMPLDKLESAIGTADNSEDRGVR